MLTTLLSGTVPALSPVLSRTKYGNILKYEVLTNPNLAGWGTELLLQAKGPQRNPALSILPALDLGGIHSGILSSWDQLVGYMYQVLVPALESSLWFSTLFSNGLHLSRGSPDPWDHLPSEGTLSFHSNNEGN